MFTAGFFFPRIDPLPWDLKIVSTRFLINYIIVEHYMWSEDVRSRGFQHIMAGDG